MKDSNLPLNPISSSIPKQKISTSKKSEDWCKDNLLYWEKRLVNNNSINESSKINMKRNSELYYYNILNRGDVEQVFNPMGISKDFFIPPDFKHYKIENPKIQTLKGEELKRKFEWKVYVSNRDAISQKEEQKKNEYFQFMIDKIKAESIDENQLKAEMDKLSDYLNYDWQELRERTADELLHHFTQYLDVKTEFSKAWEFGLINNEEIICVDEHNGKPYVKACDPKTIYWQNEGPNNYIDDSDAIVDVSYMALGQVIDFFYDELKPAEIDILESRQQNLGEYKNFMYNQYYTKTEKGFIMNTDSYNTQPIEINNSDFKDYYDSEGNIRVVHCRWKSLRKIGELTFFDEAGDEQTKHVDENYKIDESLGETIKWLWITEAWETTRIGEDIYVKCKPRSVQFRKLDNISYCSLGYIGTALHNGVFDLMKFYSIQFDAYMYRTNEAMKKSFGKIGKLDLSLIPDDWNVDMWMHYATNLGWAVIDSFKEGKKGAAMGKLAGQGQSQGDVINMEQGQFIQQNMLMLQFIESQLDKLVGINPSRQGITSATPGLQLNREAIESSSNITESYFAIHDNVKLRTLRSLLEVCKYCMRGKSESIQYITSEMTSKIFEVDGDLINEAEYGLLIGSANEDARMIESLQEAVKIALQTGAVDLIQLMDVFSSDNTASIKRKIEKSVRQKQENEQKQAQQANEIEQQKLQLQAKQNQDTLTLEQSKLDMKQYEIDRKFEQAIQTEEIRAYQGQQELDQNNNGIPDPMEIAGNALKQQDIDSRNFSEQAKLIQKEREHQSKSQLEDKKLSIEQDKLKIERDKLKIEKDNQENDLQIAKINAKGRSKK